MATILLAGVDVYFRGKLDVLLASHRLVTTDSIDAPDLVICDIARVDPYEVAETYPDVPILGYEPHGHSGPARGADGRSRSRGRSLGACRAGPLAARRGAGCVDWLGDDVHHRRALIDIKDLSCVDVCPVDCIHTFERMLIIDPEECIDCGGVRTGVSGRGDLPRGALPDKWEPFVKINYAYGEGPEVVDQLVNEYATEHNVQNPPRSTSADSLRRWAHGDASPCWSPRRCFARCVRAGY